MPVSATLGTEQPLGGRHGDGDMGMRIKHSKNPLVLCPGLLHTQPAPGIFKFSKRTAALANSSALTTLPSSISRESQEQQQDSKAEEGEGPHSQEPQCHGGSVQPLQNEPPNLPGRDRGE